MDEHSRLIGLFDTTFYVKLGGSPERIVQENYASVEVSARFPDDLKKALILQGGKIIRVYLGDDGTPLAEFVNYRIDGDNIIMDIDNFSTYYVISDEIICFIHWIILLMLLLTSTGIVIYFVSVKKRREDEDEKGESDGDVKDDDKPGRRKGLPIQIVLVIMIDVIGAILSVFFGNCRWDMVSEIALVLVTGILEGAGIYATRNKKEKEN